MGAGPDGRGEPRTDRPTRLTLDRNPHRRLAPRRIARSPPRSPFPGRLAGDVDHAAEGGHLFVEGLSRHQFEERSNDTLVGDDECRPDTARTQALESTRDSTSEIGPCLALRKLEVGTLRLPLGEEFGIGRRDLLPREPLPAPEVDFPKIELEPDRRARHDQSRGFPGSGKRTRPDRFEGLAGNPHSGFERLLPTESRERHVRHAVVADTRSTFGFAMANEDETAEAILHCRSVARSSFAVNGPEVEAEKGRPRWATSDRIGRMGGATARRTNGEEGACGRRELVPISLPIEARLEGRLIRRYKRFLADVRLPDGREITVHCPNPGSMLGTRKPGSAVRCSTSDDPKRKLRHTLEMIRVGRHWVGLHAAKANAIARRALEARAYSPFSDYETIEREVGVAEGSRFDFRLSDRRSGGESIDRNGSEVCWIEVKSVTLCEDRRARFPDAVTTRGRRHLEHLMARVAKGERAALLYLVQRADADTVAPADDIDPAYAATLREAARAGVEIHALGARVRADRIRLERVLPVRL